MIPGLLPEAHDPGGKVRLALQAGVIGDAVFLDADDRYRIHLRRWIGRLEAFPLQYALWIGMNPSTAEAKLDDRTVAREWGFTAREGLPGYWKCNVMDFRATDPSMLLNPAKCPAPRSAGNLQAIRDAASLAPLIVICHGALHQRLAHYGRETVEALRRDGRELWCLGRTAGGHPRHPLYLKSDTPLQRF